MPERSRCLFAAEHLPAAQPGKIELLIGYGGLILHVRRWPCRKGHSGHALAVHSLISLALSLHHIKQY